MTNELVSYGDLPDIREDLRYLEEFTRPAGTRVEKEPPSGNVGEIPSRRYHHGLVIGRFQPPHRGHMLLFLDALALCDEITIGIGSANIIDEDNPFPAEDRRILLERALRREGIRDRIKNIVPLDDYGDGPKWLEAALRRTGPIDAVVGGNEWVNGIFEGAGYRVEPVQRHGYAATDIRRKLREDGKLRRT